MTPEQVNRAIAEALGWEKDGEQWVSDYGCGCPRYIASLPDWHRSLDAQERDVWPVILAAGWRILISFHPLQQRWTVDWVGGFRSVCAHGDDPAAACAEASLAALLALNAEKEGAPIV